MPDSRRHRIFIHVAAVFVSLIFLLPFGWLLIASLASQADLLKVPASQFTAFAKAPDGGLYASTSNLGKVFVLGPGPTAEGKVEPGRKLRTRMGNHLDPSCHTMAITPSGTRT